jgi:hypothetical protein
VSFDFVGTGVTASSVGDDVTVTIAAGAAPIDTVFSRTGTVVAEASDYDASLVDNDSTVTGTFVDDALNTLDTDKAESADARFPTTDEKGGLAGTGTPSGSNLFVTADTLTAHVDSDGSSHSDVTDNATAIGVNAASIEDFRGASAGIGSWAHAGSALEVPGAGEFTTDNANPNLVTQIEIGYQSEYNIGSRALRQATADSVITFRAFDTANAFTVQYVITSVVDPNDGNPITINVDNAETTANGSAFSSELYGVDLYSPSGSSAGTMAIEDEGTPVPNGPHDTMNFIGGGVTAEDDGGGVVTVTIAPGAAPVDTVFGRTGTVVAEADDYLASLVENIPAGDIAAVTVQAAINELDTDKAAVGHTQAYTTVDGVPTSTFIARDTAGTGAAEALSPPDARTLLNVEDGSKAAGTSGDAYATSHEADSTAHTSTEIVDVSTVSGGTVTGALDILVAGKSDTGHAHLLADVTDAGTAAALPYGTTIGDLVQLVNEGGNAALPTVDGSLLTGIDTGTNITVQDESDPPLTTALTKLTFEGTGVTATEPGTEGEITVTVTSGAPGVIDITDGTTTVSAADKLTFDGTAFDVTDEGNDDALVEPIFNTTAGTIAEGDHTHDTLANIATGVILGRDTAGTGLSEELTPTEARILIDVTLGNLGPGVHSNLEEASVDSGKIFASLQTGQIAGLTAKGVPVAGDFLLIEDSAASDAKKSITMGDIDHDALTNFVAEEHVDWAGASAGTIHIDNYIEGGAGTDTTALHTGDTDVVPNAMLAEVAANTVKANATAGTANPTDVAVGTNTVVGRVAGNIVAAAIVEGQVADNAITLAKMAGGTDGNLITYDTNGDPAYVATGDAGEVLTSNGVDTAPTMQASPSAPTLTKTITIEDPIAEPMPFFFSRQAITLTFVRALIQGGTSIPVSIRSGTGYLTTMETNVDAQTADNTSTGADLTIADATIVAGRNVWVSFGTPVGTQTLITITIEYTED